MNAQTAPTTQKNHVLNLKNYAADSRDLQTLVYLKISHKTADSVDPGICIVTNDLTNDSAANNLCWQFKKRCKDGAQSTQVCTPF
jgi:hypothetical protein